MNQQLYIPITGYIPSKNQIQVTTTQYDSIVRNNILIDGTSEFRGRLQLSENMPNIQGDINNRPYNIFTRDISANGNIVVNNHAFIGGNCAIGGSTNLNTLLVTGTSNLFTTSISNLTVAGSSTLNALTVSGTSNLSTTNTGTLSATSISSSGTITGTTITGSALVSNGNLTVEGTTLLKDGVNVTGGVSATGIINTIGSIIGGTIISQNNLQVTNNLEVFGNTTLYGNIVLNQNGGYQISNINAFGINSNADLLLNSGDNLRLQTGGNTKARIQGNTFTIEEVVELVLKRIKVDLNTSNSQFVVQTDSQVLMLANSLGSVLCNGNWIFNGNVTFNGNVSGI